MATKPADIPIIATEDLALRTSPDTFAANSDANLTFQSQTLPSAINDHSQYANDVKDEIAATALSGDLPDMTGNAGKFTRVNSAEDAVDFFAPNVGQCRLDYTSATVATLSPVDGNLIKVAGASYEIPSAGVTLSNSGIGNSVTRNVFAYNNSGTVTLEASPTATAIDDTAGNIGVVIKSGDPSRTFVGRAYVNASGDFTAEQVESHFNAPPRPRLLHFQHKVASGTNGGTHNSATWYKRTINTEVKNEIIGATVTSSAVTLPAGTYRIDAEFACFKTGDTKARIYDNTNTAVLMLGNSDYAGSADNGATFIGILGDFTLSAEADIQFETRGNTGQSTNGMGRAASLGDEIYANVKIEVLA